MFVDDNGIVRFENSDELTPINTVLNTALTSVSAAIDVVDERIDNIVEDTGWETITDINSNFESYGSNQVPSMRRIGAWVILRGAFRCITENHIVGTGQMPMAILPELFRPEDHPGILYVGGVMQGSSSNHWHLSVHPDGVMAAARYSASTHNANLWLPFHIVYEGR